MSENQRLRELQKVLNFSSQEKFANALGIKQGSLSDIYRKKNGIGVSSSIKRILEKEYSINIDWLETGEGEMLKKTTEQNGDSTGHQSDPFEEYNSSIKFLERSIELLEQRLKIKDTQIGRIEKQLRDMVEIVKKLSDE